MSSDYWVLAEVNMSPASIPVVTCHLVSQGSALVVCLALICQSTHYITLRSLPTIQSRAATKPSLFCYDTLRSVTHPSTRRPSAFMMLYLVSLTSFNNILYPHNDFQTSIRNPKTSRWSSGAHFRSLSHERPGVLDFRHPPGFRNPCL